MSQQQSQIGATYQVHPAAELFPMMSHEDLWNLAEDIKKNGLLEPVVLYHGEVLDGRNRLKACEMAEVEPRFAEVNGDVPSPTLYVSSKNLHRRHLTTSQRAAIGAEMIGLLNDEAHKRQLAHLKNQTLSSSEPIGANETAGRSRDFVAKQVEVSPQSIQRAANVKREDPELFAKLKRGDISATAADDVLKKKARVAPEGKRGVRIYKDQPYNPQTPTQVKRCESVKERMITALSTITGLCRGLVELDLPMALAVCNSEDRNIWIERSKELSGQLRQFSKKLEETTWQQQQS